MRRFLLLLALLLTACPAVGPEPLGASATIGPDGGSLSLPDGTTFVVPAGAVGAPTQITLIPAAQEWVPYEDQGYVRAGAPFSIEPHLRSEGAPFEIRIPLDLLPNDLAPEHLEIAATSDGVIDWQDPVGDDEPFGRIHPLRRPARIDADAVVFEWLATDPSVVRQPMGLGDEAAAWLEGSPWLFSVPGTLLGLSCSGAANRRGLPWPGVDSDVSLTTGPMAREVATALVGMSGGARTAFIQAVDDFVLRSCLATWRSVAYYRSTVGVYVPGPVPLTLQWDRKNPDGSCYPVLGTANGQGMSLYFNPQCTTGYVGRRPITATSSGFNSAGPVGTIVDSLEATAGHELWHYVDDNANGATDMIAERTEGWRTSTLTEGGADAMSDELHDTVQLRLDAPPITQKSLWDGTYDAYPLWKYLDWTAEGPKTSGRTLAALVTRMRDRSLAEEDTPLLQREDLEAVLDALSPSAPGPTIAQVEADFAAAYLLLHDFERAVPLSDGSVTDPDPSPDITGARLPETARGDLWGSDVGSPAIDTPSGPDQIPAVVSTLPTQRGVTLDPGVSRMMTLDTGAAISPGVGLLIEAAANSGGAPYADVAVRLYWRPAALPDRAELLWAPDLLEPGARVSVASAKADGDRLVAILTNHGTQQAAVALDLSELAQKGLVLSFLGGSIGGLTLDGPGTAPVCSDGDVGPVLEENVRHDVAQVGGLVTGYAVSHPFEGVVRFYEDATCTEAATLAVSGLAVAGPGPMDLSADHQTLVVGTHDPNDLCAPGAVYVVNLANHLVTASVDLPHGATDLTVMAGLAGDEAVATIGGHAGCEDTDGLAVVDVDALMATNTLGAAPELLVETIPLPGAWWIAPNRITTPPDRSHAVFTMGEWNGRIGILDADHDLVVLGPDLDDEDENWDEIQDIAVTTGDDGDLHLLFVTERSSASNNLDSCLDGGLCSGLRWIRWTPGTTDPTDYWFGGDRVLPHRFAHRLGITPDRKTLYIAHVGSRPMTVWDLGSGALDASVWDATTPYVQSESNVTEIVMPR